MLRRQKMHVLYLDFGVRQWLPARVVDVVSERGDARSRARLSQTPT